MAGASRTAATALPGTHSCEPPGGYLSPEKSRANIAVPPEAPPLGPGTAADPIDFQPFLLAHAEAAGMAAGVSQVS